MRAFGYQVWCRHSAVEQLFDILGGTSDGGLSVVDHDGTFDQTWVFGQYPHSLGIAERLLRQTKFFEELFTLANELHGIAPEHFDDTRQFIFGRWCVEVFDDFEVDTASLQEGQCGTRFSTAGIVIDLRHRVV